MPAGLRRLLSISSSSPACSWDYNPNTKFHQPPKKTKHLPVLHLLARECSPSLSDTLSLRPFDRFHHSTITICDWSNVSLENRCSQYPFGRFRSSCRREVFENCTLRTRSSRHTTPLRTCWCWRRTLRWNTVDSFLSECSFVSPNRSLSLDTPDVNYFHRVVELERLWCGFGSLEVWSNEVYSVAWRLDQHWLRLAKMCHSEFVHHHCRCSLLEVDRWIGMKDKRWNRTVLLISIGFSTSIRWNVIQSDEQFRLEHSRRCMMDKAVVLLLREKLLEDWSMKSHDVWSSRHESHRSMEENFVRSIWNESRQSMTKRDLYDWGYLFAPMVSWSFNWISSVSLFWMAMPFRGKSNV